MATGRVRVNVGDAATDGDLVVDGDLRVGGSTSPVHTLHVTGTPLANDSGWTSGDLAIWALGSEAGAAERFGVGYKHSTGMIMSVYKAGGSGTFGATSHDAMTILDTSGNVGIGTSNPAHPLVVNGVVNVGTNLSFVASPAYIQTTDGGNAIGIWNDGATVLMHNTSNKLATSATGVTVTGTVIATAFTGTASVATNVTVVADGTDSARYPVFVGSTSGDLGAMTDAGIAYNPSTNTLTTTTFSGALSGNASTATALATARTIGGTSFDGTANIAVGLAGTATALATARTIGGTSFDGTANIAVGLAVTATALATARDIGGTSFDGTGDIAVALAAEATALATARDIGGVSFDGTGNINLPGVNTGGSQDTSGNAATAAALETARTIGGVSFNGSGNINLPGVNTAGNQDTSGTAADATVLETARTINGVSFNGSANITVTAAAGTLSGTALKSTVVTSSLTSVGTLADLTVTGDLAVNTDTLFVDASQDGVGINMAPNALYALDVLGQIHSTDNHSITGSEKTYAASDPGTGTEDDAQWKNILGTYYIVRNDSRRSGKENETTNLGDFTVGLIDQLDVTKFNRINNPSVDEIGLISDDVDLVSQMLTNHGTDENGDVMLGGINKTGWMSLLTLAVQDIRTRLAALEA